MNKDELLKIYSAYLPYGLNYYPSEKSDLFHDLYANNFPHTTLNYQLALQEKDPDAIKISKSYLKQKSPFLAIEEGELFLGQFESSLGFDIDDVFASEVKPILYDLSYLTKPIEHEGKKIIPMEELAKEFDMNVIEYNMIMHNAGSKTFDWILAASYPVIQKMLEYHLNVFQLPESEYINKATLTNK